MDLVAGSTRLTTLVPGGGFQVLDGATLQPLPWAALPAGAQVVSLRFADADTLLVLATDGTTRTLYRTTATDARPLFPCNDFSRVTSADFTVTFGLFVEKTAPASGGVAVSYYDLASGETIDLSSSTIFPPLVSDDRRLAGFLDMPPSGSFTMIVFDLVEKRPIAVGPSISAWPGFVPGGHDLIYLDDAKQVQYWALGRRPTLLLDQDNAIQLTASHKIYFTAGSDVEGDIEVLALP
jgi:hypothetical protein